ncbi:MAG TPA: hypothetical protein DD632_03510 [Oribacterium sp.]|nr:hypothetical protein [Oribacterium sp.]
MATYISTVSEKRKNACAINLMRSMLIKFAQKHNLPFEEAMLQFAESSTYDMLFDFDTAVWKEGPDYLLDLYEDEIRSTHSIAM